MSDALLESIRRDAQPLYDATTATAESAEQRTAAWLYERVGHCTASKFHAVMSSRKDKKEAAPRRNYRVQLAVERLLNEPAAGYRSEAMEWGTAQEPEARMAYEAQTGAIVEETGFIHHPRIEWCGGSPDGLIGADGMIEIKCPYESAVHVVTMMDKDASEHSAQMQGLMWITGRQWCDFVSFDPRMPSGIDLYVQRIERNDAYIATLEEAVIAFLDEVDAQHKAFMELIEKARDRA